jgi:hypothetical protein
VIKTCPFKPAPPEAVVIGIVERRLPANACTNLCAIFISQVDQHGKQVSGGCALTYAAVSLVTAASAMTAGPASTQPSPGIPS